MSEKNVSDEHALAAEHLGDEQPADDGDLLADLRAEADEHRERHLRALAELDNTRKRAQRDVEAAHRFAIERFAADLASVRDSLEMGLQAAAGEHAEALREGIEMTLRQLDVVLERHGVRVIDPAGEAFDPDLHEAMAVVPAEGHTPDTVVTVVQKGLFLNGRLLRPARVLIAAGPGA